MPLSASTLQWIAVTTGTDRVLRTRRLVGGLSASVTACWTSAGPVVLRRYAEAPEGPNRITREATTLAGLGPTEVPAPQLLAADPDGSANDGVPSLLMTRLPGAPLLRPADPDDWLRQLAAVLAVVHAAAVPAPPFQPWLEPAELVAPPWSAHPQLWQVAIDAIRQGSSPYDPVFVHHDFQHFNVTWSRQRLTGVLDWVDASTGPADADVAHCRLNLAALFSAERAERFRVLYEQITGRRVDPWWDLAGLLGYLPGWDHTIAVQAGPRATVDVAGMHGRVDELLTLAVARL